MVLYLALTVSLALATPNSPQIEKIRKEQRPTAEQLGRIDLDRALELADRYVRLSFQSGLAPYDPKWAELDPFAYEVEGDRLRINYSRATVIFWRSNGKFRGGFAHFEPDQSGDIGPDAAREKAVEYFHFLEPGASVHVELERTSVGEYQFMVRKTVNGIPLANGFNCRIEKKYGRLIQSIYEPSYPIHASSRIAISAFEANDAAVLALSRYLPGTSFEFRPQNTVLEYGVPRFLRNKETTTEQESIAAQGMAIPIYRVEAQDMIVRDGRQTYSRRLFVYVDARSGHVMAISDLPMFEKAGTGGTTSRKAVAPVSKESAKVLSGERWVPSKHGLVSSVEMPIQMPAGREGTIRVGFSVYRVCFDVESKLVWEQSKEPAWAAGAHPDLISNLSKAKPSKKGFGKDSAK